MLTPENFSTASCSNIYKSYHQLRPSTSFTAIRYYLCTSHTDMRKGFDSLCDLVSSQMALNALSGEVFISINKRCNQVKLLLQVGDALSQYYKGLEKGTYERATGNENSTKQTNVN